MLCCTTFGTSCLHNMCLCLHNLGKVAQGVGRLHLTWICLYKLCFCKYCTSVLVLAQYMLAQLVQSCAKLRDAPTWCACQRSSWPQVHQDAFSPNMTWARLATFSSECCILADIKELRNPATHKQCKLSPPALKLGVQLIIRSEVFFRFWQLGPLWFPLTVPTNH